MKKLYAITISLLLLLNLSSAQVPQGFKYQTAIRDNNGAVIANKLVSIKLSLLTSSANGTAIYSEVHKVATNDFGVANLNVGNGTVGLGNFSTIDWGSNTFFLKTEVDINNGTNFAFMGSSQLLSVPFAMYAAKSANAADDKDKDSTNELQVITLNNNNLQLNKNGGSVDLTKYDKDSQQLVLNGNTLSITKGNSIVLSGAVDLDADPTNEIQNLSLSKDTLKLTKANFVVLPKDNDADSTNEIQSLTYRNDTLQISKSNQIVMPKDNDRDSLNELQTISRSNDTLYLSKSNFTVLPKVNTMPSGSIITLENYDSTLLNNGYTYLGRTQLEYERKIADSASWQWELMSSNERIFPDGISQRPVINTGTDMILSHAFYGSSGCKLYKYNFSNSSWSSVNIPNSTCFTTNSFGAVYDNINGSIFISDRFLGITKLNINTNTTIILDSTNYSNPVITEFTMIWTGTDLIIWGGVNNTFGGKKFNPNTKVWSTISNTNAPPIKRGHTAIWTGTEMLIWGGINQNFGINNDSTIYKYNPITNTWSQIVGLNSPKGVYLHTAVWTGVEMIVFGGQNAFSGSLQNNTYKYNLLTNNWIEIPMSFKTPLPRHSHLAIYNNNEMILLGGISISGSVLSESFKLKFSSPTYDNSSIKFLHLFKKN